jgi:hypothetical protein
MTKRRFRLPAAPLRLCLAVFVVLFLSSVESIRTESTKGEGSNKREARRVKEADKVPDTVVAIAPGPVLTDKADVAVAALPLPSDAPSDQPSDQPTFFARAIEPKINKGEAPKEHKGSAAAVPPWPPGDEKDASAALPLASDAPSDQPSDQPTFLARAIEPKNSKGEAPKEQKGDKVPDAAGPPPKDLVDLAKLPLPSDAPSEIASSVPTAIPARSRLLLSASDPPSDQPSDVPTSISRIAAISAPPSDQPTSLAVEIESVSSAAPSDVPTSIAAIEEATATGATSDSPSLATSDAPSMAPIVMARLGGSEAPSDVPSVIYTASSVTSDSPSLLVSGPTVPRIDSASSPPSDVPSLTPGDSVVSSSPPSGVSVETVALVPETAVVPFTIPSPNGEVMDEESVDLFEEACATDFLAVVLPLVYDAEYGETTCEVISQSIVSAEPKPPQRRLYHRRQLGTENQDGTMLTLITRVSTMTVLPEGVVFTDIVNYAATNYSGQLEQVVVETVPFFSQSNGRDVVGDPAANQIPEKEKSSEDNGLPILPLALAVVGGAILAVLAVAGFRRVMSPQEDHSFRDMGESYHDDTEEDQEPQDEQMPSIAERFQPTTPKGRDVRQSSFQDYAEEGASPTNSARVQVNIHERSRYAGSPGSVSTGFDESQAESR